MAKRIRMKLMRELKDFEPKLLEEECMFEAEEAESELQASESYLSESVVSAERKKNKTAGTKPLTIEDLTPFPTPEVAAGSEPMAPPSTKVGPIVIDKARAEEPQTADAQAEGTTRLAGVTLSTNNNGDLLPVNLEQQGGTGVPAATANEENYDGCTGRI